MRNLITSVVICLILVFNPAFAAKEKSIQPRKTRLYFASALFNGREVRFNQDLAGRLEAMGYRVILPQRDGFVYVSLENAIKKSKLKTDTAITARDLIYLLNVGTFIPQTDIVIANLDEPLDPGVIVELTYAHLMGKKVIGLRTDLRMSYGKKFGTAGVHTFVGLQCDEIIDLNIPGANLHDASAAMQVLAKKINNIASKTAIADQPVFERAALENPAISNLLQASKLVFKGVKGLHTESGLNMVITNYTNNHKLISQLAAGTKVVS